MPSLVIACGYWSDRRINVPADRDDLIRVTRLVNGGRRGLAQRRRYLARAKAVLARLTASGLSAAGDRPVLHRGSRGAAVAELQAMLADHGLRLAVNGDFGPATELAVRTWQRSYGLVPDGMADLLNPHGRYSLAARSDEPLTRTGFRSLTERTP